LVLITIWEVPLSFLGSFEVSVSGVGPASAAVGVVVVLLAQHLIESKDAMVYYINSVCQELCGGSLTGASC
jgi:hypothetical protein